MIDSENVGDAWISLLPAMENEDRMMVFYTEHSPHMSYKSLILLKESPREVLFIKCFEGSNALDFQLCTELGWIIGQEPEKECIIVSNDNGFDAVVKYWNRKQKNVRRLKVSEIKSEVRPSAAGKETVKSAVKAAEPEAEPASGEEVISEEEICEVFPRDDREFFTEEVEITPPAAHEVSEPEEESVTITEESLEVLYLVGKENLLELHQALTLIYGPEDGKAIYNAFKSDSSYRSFLQGHKKLSTGEKCRAYCEIVFAKAGVEMPKGFSEYVLESWKKKKNLNTLRGALMTRYGKNNFNTYYSLIRSHTKIIDKIR